MHATGEQGKTSTCPSRGRHETNNQSLQLSVHVHLSCVLSGLCLPPAPGSPCHTAGCSPRLPPQSGSQSSGSVLHLEVSPPFPGECHLHNDLKSDPSSSSRTLRVGGAPRLHPLTSYLPWQHSLYHLSPDSYYLHADNFQTCVTGSDISLFPMVDDIKWTSQHGQNERLVFCPNLSLLTPSHRDPGSEPPSALVLTGLPAPTCPCKSSPNSAVRPSF